MHVKNRLTRLLKEFFFKSSWVTIFLLTCLALYENNIKNFNHNHNMLLSKYADLEKKKLHASMIHKELLFRVNSQSDPAWLELVLIKSLGLVPEGQKKIILLKNNDI